MMITPAYRVFLISMALAILPCDGRASSFSLWVADGMIRVMRDERPRSSKFIHLHAARGEWEPFQVVVSGDRDVVTGIHLSVSELRGPRGNVVAAPAVFREHYTRVSISSKMSPLPPGDYPDALVPLDFPPQALPPAPVVNQPFWIDVFVPRGTPAGVYHCTIRARSKTGEESSVEAAIEVWGFDLPLVPKLRSQIGFVWRTVAQAHGFDSTIDEPGPELTRLLEEYADLIAAHRLSIDQPRDGFPDARTGEFDRKKAEQALHKHFFRRHCASIALPMWTEWPLHDPLGSDRKRAMRFVADWVRMVESLGCGSRAYAMFGDLDEPNSAEAYDLVRRWGDFFNDTEMKHGVRIPLFVSEQPTPEKPEWGSLDGAADIWAVLCEDVWTDLEGPNPARNIAKQLAKGNEVWTYPALVQVPDSWLKLRGRPEKLTEGNPPAWILDYPPMNFRILGWLMPIHGITGFSYWDILHRADEVDVWKTAGNFINRGWDEKIYNGDGLLIYPATIKKHGINAPFASMRLKWAREMAEDFDYIMLAAEKGLMQRALQIGATFARGFGDWNDNVPALFEARRQIGDLLSSGIMSQAAAPTQERSAP